VEHHLASTLNIQSFLAHYAALLVENSMKSISTINPVITQNTEYSIVKVHSSFIDLKLGVLLDHGVSLCFVLLLAF